MVLYFRARDATVQVGRAWLSFVSVLHRYISNVRLSAQLIYMRFGTSATLYEGDLYDRRVSITVVVRRPIVVVTFTSCRLVRRVVSVYTCNGDHARVRQDSFCQVGHTNQSRYFVGQGVDVYDGRG